MIYYQRYYSLLINGCITLALIIIYHLLVNPSAEQQMVSINITQLTQEWITSIAKQKLSKEETTAKLTRHAVALESVLQELSTKHHWVMVSSQNILAGAPDRTSFVSEEVNKKLEKF